LKFIILTTVHLGEDGEEAKKTALFEEAVDKTNEWTGSIDTIAQEELVDLIDAIANAVGLGHIDNDGEGLSAGRDWKHTDSRNRKRAETDICVSFGPFILMLLLRRYM
jgi:hypothetical protein